MCIRDSLKVKVGKEGEKDVERIAAIREAVGPNVQLRVDANQGWEAKEAVRIIRAMEDRGLCLDLVEQPVPAMDTDGLEHVTRNVETPILADEAVFSPRDAENIIRRGAANLINIKLMKTGGIWNALKICRMAEEHGVECMQLCIRDRLNPDVRFIGFTTTDALSGALAGTLSFGQSALLVWPHLVSRVALALLAFAVAYIAFMRQEVLA